MNIFLFLTTFPCAVAIYALLYKLRPKFDLREPPVIWPKVPFVGHLIGLVRYGIPYFLMISVNHAFPIFTIPVFSKRIYVVNSSSLISSVQRNSKSISFDTFFQVAANRMAGINGDGLRLLDDEKNGGNGVGHKVLRAMHTALLGSGLDALNRTMLTNLAKAFDQLQSRNVVDLQAWIRHAISMASTEAIYGEQNPYGSKEMEDAFSEYESNLTPLLINIMPRITGRRALRAREKMVSKFLEYYQRGGHENSSEFERGRWKSQRDAGATIEDIARLETAVSIGIISNATSSAFWLLFEILSRPQLCFDVRKELSLNAIHSDEAGNILTIELGEIRDKCPLLLATFQEVLRLRSYGSLIRVVHEDVLLNDQYLVKAGSLLQMPSQTINREHAAWGDNSATFDPYRCLKDDGSKGRKSTKFMTFGVSPSTCPGRHFATGEVLAATAMMLLRYDVVPESGKWECPKVNPKAVEAFVPPPVERLMVSITRKEEMKGKIWTFGATEGKGKFGLWTG